MIIPEDKEQFLRELEDAIHAFETKLGQGQFVRPFVCTGTLTDCDVFIVGVNPREDMEFRPYWDGREYCKSNWEREYLRQRFNRTGNEGASRTRNKLNFFCQGASPAHALETNVYPIATDTERELSRIPAYQDETIFALVLQRLRPRVVITHGATARNRVLELLGVEESGVQEMLLDMQERPHNPTKFTRVFPQPWGGSQAVYLKALDHLARNYSYEFMRQLGERVSAIVAVEAAASASNR